jgi:hypothetical protein
MVVSNAASSFFIGTASAKGSQLLLRVVSASLGYHRGFTNIFIVNKWPYLKWLPAFLLV